MHDKVVDQEVKGILQSTGVVASEIEVERLDLLLLAFDSLGCRILNTSVNNVLSLKLVKNLRLEFGGAHVLREFSAGREGKLVSFWNHTL
jgi:hypothetical protein